MFCTVIGLVLATAAALQRLLPLPENVVWGEGVCKTDIPVVKVTDGKIAPEGYRLEVSPKGIVIATSDAAGGFYAERTLDQLKTKDGYLCCTIDDKPRFRYRGILIDECRHFIGKENVLRTIEAMSDYKLNVLHWHLVDDQGWRLEIPRYPDLVKYGAVRRASPKFGAEGWRDKNGIYHIDLNTDRYGPFYYTADDVREVLAFAAKRHVKVIPEIELPGHALAALASYPELACNPEKFRDHETFCEWGESQDLYCLGNPKTIKFLEDVLDYVCELFPSDMIHIGGDECPRICWRKCPKCLALVEREKLGSADKLQAWATRHFVAYLAKKGRRIIGWDEILGDTDIPKSAIGMSWRKAPSNVGGNIKFADYVSGAAGAARGHDMIMANVAYCYLDYGQGLEGDPFQYIGQGRTMEKLYSYDPCEGVSEEHRSHVLGGQCCMWGEFIWGYMDFTWKMWPRAFAISEVLWSYPSVRDYGAFKRRAAVHREKLVKRGYPCAPVK